MTANEYNTRAAAIWAKANAAKAEIDRATRLARLQLDEQARLDKAAITADATSAVEAMVEALKQEREIAKQRDAAMAEAVRNKAAADASRAARRDWLIEQHRKGRGMFVQVPEGLVRWGHPLPDGSIAGSDQPDFDLWMEIVRQVGT